MCLNIFSFFVQIEPWVVSLWHSTLYWCLSVFVFVLCFCQGLFVNCQFMVTNSLFSFTPNLLSLFPLQTQHYFLFLLHALSWEPSFTFFRFPFKTDIYSPSLPKPSFISFSLSLLNPSSFHFPFTIFIYPKLHSPFSLNLLTFSFKNLFSLFHPRIHYLSSFSFFFPSP